MPRHDVVAIAELGDRVQEHGRIRMGVKTERAMRAIDTFRFTSPDQAAIERLAELYGGKARPWNEPKANPAEQYEVITQAKAIDIFLPPGGLSCWYELWSGGGCVRRCDGVTVSIARSEPDPGMVDVPCLCGAEKIMRCRPYTRLQVVLPELPFAGVWRLETKGWTAAHEMPAMEALIASIQGRGVVKAKLVIEKAQAENGRRKFVVPRIQLADSALALAAGAANVQALHPGSIAVAELGTGKGDDDKQNDADWFDQDNEIIDAELVDEDAGEKSRVNDHSANVGQGEGQPAPEAGHVAPDTSPGAGPSPARTGSLAANERKLILVVGEAATFVGLDADLLRHALARKASQGRTASTRELDRTEISTVIAWANELLAETHSVKVTRRDPPTVKLIERPMPT